MENLINKTEEQDIKKVSHDPKDYLESENKTVNKTKNIIFFLGFVIVIGIGVTAYFFWTEIKQGLTPGRGGKACQTDAKICPDGTSLNRTLPDCQFPTCPSGEKGLDITYWQEYDSEDLGLSFKYPEEWMIKSEEMGLLELENKSNKNQKIMIFKTSVSSPEEVNMDLFEADDIEAGGYEAKKEVFKNKKEEDKYYIKAFVKEKGILVSVDADKKSLVELSLIFDNIVFSMTFQEEIPVDIDLNVDTDADGLYDFEEAEYGTDPDKADSDGDGYNDGDELKNLYNPAGEGKLAEDWSTPAGAVAVFEKIRANCQEGLFREKIYFAEDFYQPIIDMAMNMGEAVDKEELNDFFREFKDNKEEIKDDFIDEFLIIKVYANNISSIKLLGKKITDKNNMAYKYKVAYSADDRGYAPEAEEKNLYLTKINNEWLLDFKNHIKYALENELLLEGAREKSRDAKRIADIRQIQTGLELYYNGADRYPESIEVGGMIELNGMVYMSQVPGSPEFESGDCTLEKNNYSYTVKNGGKEYELSYCLEDNTWEIPKGVNIASPSGVADESKNKTLQPKYKDCRRESDKDAARVTDIKQIQIALELYFNDHIIYPKTVNFGESIKGEKSAGGIVYMQKVPQNPAPTIDVCKGYENYTYTQENNGAEYKLVYCLEKSVGGINAGPHTATPSGIQ